MKAKLVVQVKLQSGDTERVCLIDNARVRAKSWITLKNSEDPKRRWLVLEIYPVTAPVNPDWHVGGL